MPRFECAAGMALGGHKRRRARCICEILRSEVGEAGSPHPTKALKEGIHSMPELKTRPTTASVSGFIKGQPDEQMRADCLALVALMEHVTGEPAVMWGPSI